MHTLTAIIGSVSTSDRACNDAQSSGGTDTPAAPQVVHVIPPTPASEPADPSSSQSHSTPQEQEQDSQTAMAGDDPDSSTRVRSASWWDYVGWRGQASLEDPVQKQEIPSDDHEDMAQNPDDEDRTDAQAPQPAEQPQASLTAATQSQNSSPELQGEASSLATETQPELHDTKLDKNPASILSADTAGPSWYSPWAWYPSGQTPTAHVAEPSDGSTAPKTDAELVKEEALARDGERRVEDSQPQPQPEPAPAPAANAPVSSSELVNPIQSSIADNRSGWMSFFMSKSLAVKSVTDGADDGRVEGMEVMEIDDEPDPEVAIEVPIGDHKAKATDIQAQGTPKKKPSDLVLSSSPKPPSLASSAAIPMSPKTPKSPAKAPTKEKDREPKKPETAPPLTDSESVKRSARTPSPTPSGAGPAPPKPNFVLPTWEDTFHILPRSQPPPRPHGPKSKLTGALSYVAGALFSGEGGLGKGKGKGKGKAKGKDVDGYGTWASPPLTQQDSGEFVSFGQELPKALDVVGETLNPYILNGGCRVVVIGVAGWSPGKLVPLLYFSDALRPRTLCCVLGRPRDSRSYVGSLALGS